MEWNWIHHNIKQQSGSVSLHNVFIQIKAIHILFVEFKKIKYTPNICYVYANRKRQCPIPSIMHNVYDTLQKKIRQTKKKKQWTNWINANSLTLNMLHTLDFDENKTKFYKVSPVANLSLEFILFGTCHLHHDILFTRRRQHIYFQPLLFFLCYMTWVFYFEFFLFLFGYFFQFLCHI